MTPLETRAESENQVTRLIAAQYNGLSSQVEAIP